MKTTHLTLRQPEPETILAIAKSATEKMVAEARKGVGEGCDIEVDVLVRIHGTLSIGRSCDAQQVNKVCPWRIALAALNRLNAPTIAAIVREAAAMTDKEAEPLKLEVTKAAETLLAPCTVRRAAPVRFNGSFEEVTP